MVVVLVVVIVLRFCLPNNGQTKTGDPYLFYKRGGQNNKNPSFLPAPLWRNKDWRPVVVLQEGGQTTAKFYFAKSKVQETSGIKLNTLR